MASLGGLISGVLGGAAKAYGEGAQMEMKKQSELDLRKQLLEAESEKRLREDETRRERDRAEETYKMSPDYLAKVATAEAGKYDALIKAGVPEARARSLVAEGKAAAKTREDLAPINAAADVVEGKAKAGVQVDLAPEQAKVAKAQFDAEKELRGLRVDEATADQIKKAKALVADPAYMEALKKENAATHAHLIEIANIQRAGAKEVAQIKAASAGETSEDRLEAARLKALKGPGGGSTTPTTADLQRQVTAAENALAAKLAVKKSELYPELGSLQKRTDPASKARLEKATAEIAVLEAARKRLTDWSKTPAAPAPAAPAPAAPAPAAPAAAAPAYVPAMPPPANRPPLDSFRK